MSQLVPVYSKVPARKIAEQARRVVLAGRGVTYFADQRGHRHLRKVRDLLADDPDVAIMTHGLQGHEYRWLLVYPPDKPKAAWWEGERRPRWADSPTELRGPTPIFD